MCAVPPGRLAVIGDVGGHVAELISALCVLGFDPVSSLLPADLVVVQVGDLIHRGPASAEVVALVDEVMAANPGRWVQLAGNHEAQYLHRPVFQWHEKLDRVTVATLRRWWESSTMRLAAAFDIAAEVTGPDGEQVRAGAGELLVSHAGLTFGCWDRLGQPPSAFQVADALNGLGADPSSLVWRPGLMLGGAANHSAGPVWAEAGRELVASWATAGRVPGFHQAHGHTSLVVWPEGRFRSPEVVAFDGVRIEVDRLTRLVRCEVGAQMIWGTDPCHGRLAARTWSPLVLPLTTLPAPAVPAGPG
jgi:hypothetical protein